MPKRKKKKRKPPVMTFKEVKEIYQTKKQLTKIGDFSFVKNIFDEIHDEYIERAKNKEKMQINHGMRGAGRISKN